MNAFLFHALSVLLSSQGYSVLGQVEEKRVAFCLGDQLQLDCSIWKANDTCMWMYSGRRGLQKLASLDKRHISLYPNLSKNFETRAEVMVNGSLVIKEAIKSDQGTYRCENHHHFEWVSYSLEFDCQGKTTRETVSVCVPSDDTKNIFSVLCEALDRVKPRNIESVGWRLNGQNLVVIENGTVKRNRLLKGLAGLTKDRKTLFINTTSEHFTRVMDGSKRGELSCFVSKANGGTSERHLVSFRPITCTKKVLAVNSTLTLGCPVVSSDVLMFPTRKVVWELRGKNGTSQRVIVTRLRDKINVAPDFAENLSVTPEFALVFSRLRDIAGSYSCRVTDMEGVTVGQTFTVTVSVTQSQPCDNKSGVSRVTKTSAQFLLGLLYFCAFSLS
ncbi:predicted protein [Nematostella vectensis]|uniref:Ig-like domain-containing protein n=1 Tax=Nematostella vectensis TaxID=45351 RepID=A7SN15_NEMVE|nr:predicted protein [Nematostella vectensis]|eukprot:XP_001627030.1 predicted protein [Nematostella vectensis]